MFGIEQVGFKCVFQRAESAVKDKCNTEWDLYPCIQVAFYHPVTTGWEAMCPFLWCWYFKWSCLRLCIIPHYRYNLPILSSVAEQWRALSLVILYVLQEFFLSYLCPHVSPSSCIIHYWRICISLTLKVPRVCCNDERNGGRRSWMGLGFFDLARLKIYLLCKNLVTKRQLSSCQWNISDFKSDMAHLDFYLKKRFLSCLSTKWPVCVSPAELSAGKRSLQLFLCTDPPPCSVVQTQEFLWLW